MVLFMITLKNMKNHYKMNEENVIIEIENAILETDELVKKVELFDVYRSKEKESEKSVAVHITYLDKNKTLETKEIDTITQKIKKQLELRFGVKFRD